MNDIPTSVLFGALIFLIILSGFFSGSETGLMTLNRYRLRHLAKDKHPGAMRASRLLERPDRLIGLILLGNNFVNILASSLSTVIALRLWGEAGIAIAAGLLTLVILIFAEVTPKTIAALYPERVAFPAALIYIPLLKILYPLVWVVNLLVNGLLKLFGVSADKTADFSLSKEELRTVVSEAGAMIPARRQKMLIRILDLEDVTVEDIMVPRSEITGIDLEDEWDTILSQVTNSPYTRLPVYQDNIDNVVGMLHLRRTLHLINKGRFDREELTKLITDAYFTPESTSLNRQLLNFQHNRQRTGLVVDEYGDIQGLVTLEDLLEEIVGEFTTDPSDNREIHPQSDGSYLINGSASIRELNRTMQWQLPSEGPKTLNGLILEHLESIPQTGTSLLVNGYPIEIVQSADNVVKTARITSRIIEEDGSDGS
ncbi:magnesium/cobalt efflux protein [Solemya pervernicosa gill symbiont]|uniref:Magnesium and cobalt efflux protein CorC n=2 Tax=Gammaproteobacteria incertae sedis TaxID=118884 RepID=A0A1T2L7M0_9GAMM|nr:HlyC/CorC family transporter [Candidatus Reidiella endopervernicosa]OOZ41107.1 magnesium/cobalt efflux protein [Solemya pervernicosa gill symbiont]QKQ26271.1 HlyC/CorC family transporter [Candidatus Reidiella endopervernicosa]